MFYKRLLCTQTAVRRHLHPNQWPIKQVTKSNFSKELEELKTHISSSDFVAVSLQKTGGCSVPWQRILSFDTADTAYLKAKTAAERFQILQFSVCPFSIKDSKLIAHPYNFHLFPRDELKVGLPSYSFSCQSSYLTSMAKQGFDFNECIYNGISYLSRAQETATKVQIENLSHNSYMVQSSFVHSVADSVFMERIKSRVKSWINACKTSNKTEDALISSLRKLILGSELHGSRPCLNIDVCSERQIQLALETLKEFVDVVPLRVPVKGGGMQAVRVVLTSSKEDKILFEKELQNKEEEQNKRVRGFREVIDLISASQKPILAHNSLNDFAFIYSKFLTSLPPTMDDFRTSLRLIFPQIIDVNHLMKEIGPFEKINNIPAAISYLKNRFFAPVDMEIPNQGKKLILSRILNETNLRHQADPLEYVWLLNFGDHPGKTKLCVALSINNRLDMLLLSGEANINNIHGNNVLKICQLFVKLCTILKISPEVSEGDGFQLSPSLQCHANKFTPCSNSSEEPIDKDVGIWTGNNGRIGINNLVFMWGFEGGISANKLKGLLRDSHEVFSQEYDIRMVDKTCAVVVFWNPGFSELFLSTIDSAGVISDKLKDLISEGLRVTGYETYKKVCEKSGLWRSNLAQCLDEALEEETEILLQAKSREEQSLIYWNNDEMINLEEL